MEHEPTHEGEPTRGLARRGLLAAGLAGAVATLAPLYQQVAGASTTPSEPEGTAATTTTAPHRPTAADVALLGRLQALELGAERLYLSAVRAGALDDVATAVIATIHQNHGAFGSSISGLLGREAPGEADEELIARHADVFAGSDQSALLSAASELEAGLADAHVKVIGKLQAVRGARLLASICTSEARHGTVLAELQQRTSLDDLLSPKGETLTVEA